MNQYGNKQSFYPTPIDLVAEMLMGADLKQFRTVLEPSAGKGNIVDYLRSREEKANEYCYRDSKNVNLNIDCIEIDQELAATLKGKGYRVVHDDFLTFQTHKRYDLIVMNPPFEDGDKHLLKALELQERGGSIICLLNAETLRNPCTNRRADLVRKLDEYGASITYKQDAFRNAERETGVEIALVKVTLPVTRRESEIFESMKKAQERKEQVYSDDIKSLIRQGEEIYTLVRQYEIEVAAGVKLIEEYYAMGPMMIRTFEENTFKIEPMLRLCLTSNHNGYGGSVTINEYLQETRGKYWAALFANPNFMNKLTQNLREQYYERLEELKDYEFSMANIYEMQLEMMKKTSASIEETILKLFDDFSHKYNYSEFSKNIHYYNGWKTNSAYKVNKRVIFPLSAYSSWGSYNPAQQCGRRLADIEKIFDYLNGSKTIDCRVIEILRESEKQNRSGWIEFKYFKVCFYKKGTTHIEFTDQRLLDKFNIFGSQKKGWLPPSYGRKAYDDMTDQEQAVVDVFNGGEKHYTEIFCERGFYLVAGSKELLLVG